MTSEKTMQALANLNKNLCALGFGFALTLATTLNPSAALADAGAFSYDPNLSSAPESWSNLPIEGNQCGGKKQSPIAIKITNCNVGANYKMQSGTCTASDLEYALGRNGPKAAFPKDCTDNTLRIPFVEGTFQAVQFHTHIGSEHTLGGKKYDAEFHIVHKQKGGDRFAVVGIFLQGDSKTDNPKFAKLMRGWSVAEQGVEKDCGFSSGDKKSLLASKDPYNIYELIPEGSNFYHYDGSLTTPPCSEVVWWEVADTPLSVSKAQMQKLIDITTSYTDPKTCLAATSASPLDSATSRPVAQDLSGRKVTRICPVDSN